MKAFWTGMSLSLAGLLWLASATVCFAQWLPVGRDANGDEILYKVERRIDHRVEVWGKRIFSEDGAKEFLQDSRANGLDTEGWNKPGHFTSFYEIDCRKNLSRVLSVVIYAADGRVVYSASFGNPGWTAIAAGSLGAIFREKVCP
ncbi:MAG: hypothetical protein KA113_04045 [Syntrophaceae bacterium]|jgi:hypothetical protein|nr:hypothetical protein [Syntrophaceae bacterium]